MQHGNVTGHPELLEPQFCVKWRTGVRKLLYVAFFISDRAPKFTGIFHIRLSSDFVTDSTDFVKEKSAKSHKKC